ncbi:MAG: UDP-N-acetylglucosamine--N-acetylmuramyl-(pentapeptide) pyrophosphoryl-undecaprenol N-acetylglucosamine transferase [Gemmatimonadaceae bacterium]|jgi:UDP-N-acetylglucosamine--N-acetylmuramyl-(pentapeptide) pyrophosphoryl-undecaprenol N-acetylglucosamine transferase|nr:UDP-N-acetylglucosamine--N-acetylmuramyl-(pentapeptide) pyrophosphoryl-undecaprenol N-acetylglucosamine transferase [Gemmatimonadaceae bacterium]
MPTPTGTGAIYFGGGGTGGHLYPAIAVAEAIQRARPGMGVHFVGAMRGVEARVLPASSWPHELLDLHPLDRRRPWRNGAALRGIVGSIRRLDALDRVKPVRAVLGTGGYAAGALLSWAVLRRRPLFLWEGNATAGLTVRLFSRWARQVYLGFPEATASLPPAAHARVLVSGNPITPPPPGRASKSVARHAWNFPASVQRVLLIFGGSQGAQALNDAIGQWLPAALPASWGAIWITGPSDHARYAAHTSDRLRVVAYQQPMADAYATADLAIARAGAMSTSELCAWGIPMVLVPLPTSAGDHQRVNARALEGAGAALLVEQAMLSRDMLDASVAPLLANGPILTAMGNRARSRARVDAADIMADSILSAITP